VTPQLTKEKLEESVKKMKKLEEKEK